MTSEDVRTTDDTPSRAPIDADAHVPGRRRWWQSAVTPHMLAILFLLGFLQYWVLGLLLVYDVVSDFPRAVAFNSYFAHWSSVGALIGYAVSRKRIRSSVIGAIIGLILSAVLMC
jgi:hypothetical protein